MIEKYSDLDESECKILCNRIAKYLDLEVKEYFDYIVLKGRNDSRFHSNFLTTPSSYSNDEIYRGFINNVMTLGLIGEDELWKKTKIFKSNSIEELKIKMDLIGA